MRTLPFICITSVFLTHLVLNLEYLERHTPSKNINMELKKKKKGLRLTILLKSPITMFSHMLTRPLNPPNRNTKVLPSHCEKVGKKKVNNCFPLPVDRCLEHSARKCKIHCLSARSFLY